MVAWSHVAHTLLKTEIDTLDLKPLKGSTITNEEILKSDSQCLHIQKRYSYDCNL